MTMADPDLIKVPEAAHRLGMHEDTAYRLARTGQLPGAVRVGGRWRVSVPLMMRALHGEAQGAEHGNDKALVPA